MLYSLIFALACKGRQLSLVYLCQRLLHFGNRIGNNFGWRQTRGFKKHLSSNQMGPCVIFPDHLLPWYLPLAHVPVLSESYNPIFIYIQRSSIQILYPASSLQNPGNFHLLTLVSFPCAPSWQISWGKILLSSALVWEAAFEPIPARLCSETWPVQPSVLVFSRLGLKLQREHSPRC